MDCSICNYDFIVKRMASHMIVMDLVLIKHAEALHSRVEASGFLAADSGDWNWLVMWGEPFHWSNMLRSVYTCDGDGHYYGDGDGFGGHDHNDGDGDGKDDGMWG